MPPCLGRIPWAPSRLRCPRLLLRLAALLRGVLDQTTNLGALLALAGEVRDFGHLQI
jgi:hypothetical protein